MQANMVDFTKKKRKMAPMKRSLWVKNVIILIFDVNYNDIFKLASTMKEVQKNVCYPGNQLCKVDGRPTRLRLLAL